MSFKSAALAYNTMVSADANSPGNTIGQCRKQNLHFHVYLLELLSMRCSNFDTGLPEQLTFAQVFVHVSYFFVAEFEVT